MWSRVYETVECLSVPPSYRSAAALPCSGFAAVGPVPEDISIGGGATGGRGGHRPPNDGVGGTMHSGPPNSDTSGP